VDNCASSKLPLVMDELRQRLLRNRRIVLGRGKHWLWTGATNSHGYGHVVWERRLKTVSRLAWVAWKGPIPDGLWVLHTCDIPACFRPDHLFLGTQADNMQDMHRKGRWVKTGNQHTGKTHCKNGHEFTTENTRWYRGSRYCKTCRRRWSRESRE
jgi:hypothetical protein